LLRASGHANTFLYGAQARELAVPFYPWEIPWRKLFASLAAHRVTLAPTPARAGHRAIAAVRSELQYVCQDVSHVDDPPKVLQLAARDWYHCLSEFPLVQHLEAYPKDLQATTSTILRMGRGLNRVSFDTSHIAERYGGSLKSKDVNEEFKPLIAFALDGNYLTNYDVIDYFQTHEIGQKGIPECVKLLGSMVVDLAETRDAFTQRWMLLQQRWDALSVAVCGVFPMLLKCITRPLLRTAQSSSISPAELVQLLADSIWQTATRMPTAPLASSVLFFAEWTTLARTAREPYLPRDSIYDDRLELRVDTPDQHVLEEEVEFEMLRGRINKVLKTLSYREREIIKLRLGFGDGYVYTQQEVAHIFKVTPLRIRQIEAKAVRKLQQPARARELVGFLP